MNFSSQSKKNQELLAEISRQKAQIRDLEQLTELIKDIAASTNVDETLKKIMDVTLKLCNASQASIYLFEQTDPADLKTLIREGEKQTQQIDHHLNRFLAGWVQTHQSPLLSNDLRETLGKAAWKEKYSAIASVLSIPLSNDDDMIGVLNVISENENERFGEREQNLFRILGKHCAQFIRDAKLKEQLFDETRRLKRVIQDRYAVQGIIGHSPKMKAVFAMMDNIVQTDVRVLIQGESGTGKERIARVIHFNGLRQDAPFIAIDCGSLPANLLESELFGYMKGAFTGATADKKGLFEAADGGTLFLDEIGNMPMELQMKLLRAIQEGEIRPLGSTQVRKVNVRIIAATNEALKKRVKSGEFRQDLYYRLNVINIQLPPLRERREDILLLANHFLKQFTERYGKPIDRFAPSAITMLEKYPWPGNIRELENAIERAVVLCHSSELRKDDFPFLEAPLDMSDTLFRPRPWEAAIQELKQFYMTKVLEHTGGVKKDAAEILQIQPTYLSRLLKNLDIDA